MKQLLILGLLLVVIVAQVPSCIKYNAAGLCSLCQLGKLVFNNKCLDVIPHCLEYSRTYTCTMCEFGFELSAESACLSTKVGISGSGEMSEAEMRLDIYYQKIKSLLQPPSSTASGQPVLYKVLRITNDQDITYHVLFKQPQGFIYTVGKINRITFATALVSQTSIVSQIGETIITDLSKDPRFKTIQQRLKVEHPSLNLDNLLITYYQEVKSVPMYRLEFFNAQNGIVELKINILSNIQAADARFESIGILNTPNGAVYQKGLTFFQGKYPQLLEGATADKIGRSTRNGWDFYLIILTKGNKTYQAEYALDSQGNISPSQLYELTQSVTAQQQTTTTTTVITITSNQTFTEITLVSFQASSDYQLIVRFLQSSQYKELVGKNLKSVWRAEYNKALLYRMLYTGNGEGVLLTLVVDSSANSVEKVQLKVLNATELEGLLKTSAGTDGFGSSSSAQDKFFASPGQDPQPVANITKSDIDTLIRDNHHYLNGLELMTLSNDSDTSSLGSGPSHYVFIYGLGNSSNPQQKWRYDVTVKPNGETDIVESRQLPEDSQRRYTAIQIETDATLRSIVSQLIQKYSQTTGNNPAVKYIIRRTTSGDTTYEVALHNLYTTYTFILMLTAPNNTIRVLGATDELDTFPVPHKFTPQELQNYPVMKQLNGQIRFVYGPLIGDKSQLAAAVSFEKDGKFMYNLSYSAPDTTQYVFQIEAKANGQYSTVGVDKIDPKSAGVQYDSSPVQLLLSQYSSDKYFLSVREELTKLYPSVFLSYQLTKVMRQRQKDGNSYWMTFTNSTKDGYEFYIIVSNSGIITIRQISRLGNAVAILALKQPVQLTQTDNDANFSKVQEAIKKANSLDGFQIVSVMLEQKVDGYYYTVTYVNLVTADKYVYTVWLALNGTITIVNVIPTLTPKPKPVVVVAEPSPTQTITIPPPQIDLVYLLSTQYQSDPYLSAIDTLLRQSYQLTGYNIYSVGYLDEKKGITYSVIYRNAEGKGLLFRVFISAGNSRPEVVDEKQLAPTLSIIPETVSAVKYENETYLPFGSFQISQPQLSNYFVTILKSSLAPTAAQYILFSANGEVYRLITSTNLIYYIHKNKYDGSYYLKSIQDVGLQGARNTIEIDRKQFGLFSSMMRVVRSADIDRIWGYYYLHYQNYLRYYQLTVATKSGLKYSLTAYEPNVPNATYVLISFAVSTMAGDYVFNDERISYGKPTDIGSMGIPTGQIVGDAGFQSEQTRPLVIRATLRGILNQYPTRQEIIYQASQRQFLSYNLMDKGLTEFSSQLNQFIYSKPLKDLPPSFNSQPFVPQLITFNKLIQREWKGLSLQDAKFKIAMVAQMGAYYRFYVVYETVSSSIEIDGLLVDSQKIILGSYRELYSIVDSPRYTYGDLENVEPVEITRAKNSRAFQICETILFAGYSHYLQGAKIQEILIDDYTNPDLINYNVVYETNNGVFLAVLDYNRITLKGQIKALVLINASRLERIASDCQLGQRTDPTLCQICKKNFHLQSNGFCYEEIRYCRVQGGGICVACNDPYWLAGNRCTSNGGLNQ